MSKEETCYYGEALRFSLLSDVDYRYESTGRVKAVSSQLIKALYGNGSVANLLMNKGAGLKMLLATTFRDERLSIDRESAIGENRLCTIVQCNKRFNLDYLPVRTLIFQVLRYYITYDMNYENVLLYSVERWSKGENVCVCLLSDQNSVVFRLPLLESEAEMIASLDGKLVPILEYNPVYWENEDDLRGYLDRVSELRSKVAKVQESYFKLYNNPVRLCRLHFRLENGEVQEVPLKDGVNRIGRYRNMDVCVLDDTVSRDTHASITINQSRGTVVLQSVNNVVYYNRAPLSEPAFLRDGDEFYLGRIRFVIDISRRFID